MYYAAACSYKHTFVRRILVILGAKISCQADQISLQDLSRRPDRGGIEGAFLLGSGAATTPAVPLRSMPHSHVVIGGDGQAADGARLRHAPWIGAIYTVEAGGHLVWCGGTKIVLLGIAQLEPRGRAGPAGQRHLTAVHTTRALPAWPWFCISPDASPH